jgi:outer membrane receptor protein involved in Fe transport
LRTQIKVVVAALSILIAWSLLCAPATAGVYGKISGSVQGAKNHEPLVGATVRVIGTSLATKTDEDGEYFIINVPVGRYDLSVTYVGYESIIKKDVRILVDLTTPVDFEAQSVAIELKTQTVVRASAPVIQRDLTASRVIFTSDRLRNLPNIVSVQSILSNYPGVVMDKKDSLHVRGGRTGQVSYYLDGYSIQDPFIAQAGMRIMPTALEELSLTSGGFSAEYGEAQSGVVNAVTRQGGSTYRGSLRMYQGATHPYDVTTGEWQALTFNQNRAASFNLSGPIPGLNGERYAFFAAGELFRDFGFLPHDNKKSFTGTSKFTIQPLPRLKINADVSYSHTDGQVYRHRDVNGASWDFNLNGLPVMENESYLAGLSTNFVPNERAMWTLTVHQFSTYTLQSPKSLMGSYWRDWPGYSEDSTGKYNGTLQDNYTRNLDYSNPYELTGFLTGTKFDPTYSYRKAVDNSATLTWIQQLSKTNQTRMGVAYDRYHVKRDAKQFYNASPYTEYYDCHPTYVSAYAQDKLEYATFVINAGVRLDYRNPDISYMKENVVKRANRLDSVYGVWTKASSKSRLAPRFGVSFPVSEKTVLHANYGVYYQTPLYRYMYMNLTGDISTGLPLLGNPDLRPEKTVSYELGMDHLVGDYLRMDVTAYRKNISDLVTTRELARIGSTTLTQFTNDDYGTATGIDVSLERLKLNGFISGSVSYGYMVARGIGSSAMEPYYTYLTSSEDTLAPVTEYPLDFDQRHTLTAVFDMRFPREWKGHFFGLPVPGGWGLTMVGYLGSGLPYTKSDSKGSRIGGRNEGRLPAYSSVDMRFNKDMFVGRADNMLTFFVEIDNLFDRHNVLNVYSRTGLPDDDYVRSGTGLALDQNQLDKLNSLYDHDPQNYSAPRTVRLGLEYSF